jgi:plasmid stability protein
MSQVLVRDVDHAAVERLKALARRNHRSLEAELRVVLEQVAATTETDAPNAGSGWADAGDFQAQVDRVRGLFACLRFDDSANLLREDRDR